MALTLDTTLVEIIDNPQARAILDKHLPGVSNNPVVAIAHGMPLNFILTLPQAAQFGLTQEKAEAILEEINKHL